MDPVLNHPTLFTLWRDGDLYAVQGPHQYALSRDEQLEALHPGLRVCHSRSRILLAHKGIYVMFNINELYVNRGTPKGTLAILNHLRVLKDKWAPYLFSGKAEEALLQIGCDDDVRATLAKAWLGFS